MRLWHKDLIEVLPRQQLLGQWRELNSIYKLQNKHLLIDFVYNHSLNALYEYSLLIIEEMNKRGFKHNDNNFHNYFNDKIQLIKFSYNEIYRYKMDKRYLKQCYYNLQEKYDCGGITQDEWLLIENKYREEMKI